MFDRATYAERRARCRSEMEGGIVLLLGNQESPMNYRDNPYPFRQDSTFLYYFGLNQPGLAAVMDVDSGRDTVYGDDLTVDDIVWMGFHPTLSERAALAGVHHTEPLAGLDEAVRQAKEQGRPVHYLPPYRAEQVLWLQNLLGAPPDIVEDGVSRKLIFTVADQRNHKSDEEIQEIEKAADVTADMHLAAYRMVRPGISEAEIAAEVHRIALASGGALSFPIIATVHGETLHNHYHGNTLRSGDLFLLDAGSETSMGYAADMSSTMPVDPVFTSRQKEIYQIALASHEAAVNALKPDVPFREIHLLACRTLSTGLKNLGLMKGDVDEAVEAGAHALFFPCGLGHLMGLDVHDMENLGEEIVGYGGKPKSTLFGLKSLRLGRKLEPGFVITIEPGVYFIPQLIDFWKSEGRFREFIAYDRLEAYRDFGGIRNEENFVITKNGARLLGKPIPKSIGDVEAIRQV